MTDSMIQPATKRGRGRPPGFVMSEAHKEKIRVAQIRRWAVRKHLAEQAAKPDC